MTREKIKKLLPILEAYANGKVIQFYCRNPEPHWQDVQSDDLIDFSEDATRYRIKPEPKYRPFNNSEECWEEMQKHQPFGWVKNGELKFNIITIRTDGIIVSSGIDNNRYSFKTASQIKFIDGTPFGIHLAYRSANLKNYLRNL